MQTQTHEMPAEDKAEPVKYQWPIGIDDLPAILRPPLDRKMTEAELRQRSLEIRRMFADLAPYKWRHYSGTIYEVEGFGTSATDGTLEVRYRKMAEFPHGHGEVFHLPVTDWFFTIVLDSPDPQNPNLVTPHGPYMVHRYVPVFEARRFETKAQIRERDA